MILLGLTGSIGMGKSAVAAMFRQAGVPVFDADAEVHEMQGPGGSLLAPIESAFPGCTNSKGVIREELGRRVFGNPDRLRLLEAIVHPAVEAARQYFLRRHRFAKLVVLDIPLLFEKGGWRKVDAVLVVSAPPAVQKRRVLSRSGMTPEKFKRILALQTPDSEKRRRADFVISTGCTMAETSAAVRALVACLRARGVRYCRSCARSSLTRKPRGLIRRPAIGSLRSVA